MRYPASGLAVLALLACGTPEDRQRDRPSSAATRTASATEPPTERATATASPVPFDVAELAPGVVVVTTEPWAANSLLVRSPDGSILLVDTPATPADTAAVLDWSVRRWGEAPRYAINSHWHLDATGGNQVLRARGVEVISSARTAELVASRVAEAGREVAASLRERDPDTARELEALRPTPADRAIAVADRARLELGGEAVTLVYPGPSHSSDSIAVWFPDRRLLYGGCAVRSDGRILSRSGADPDGWRRAIVKLSALAPTAVVPGHGRRFDPMMLPDSLAAALALRVPGAPP